MLALEAASELRFCRHQNDTAIFSALCCSRLACKTLSKCSLIKAQTSAKKVCKLSLEITSIVRMLNNKFSDDFLGGIVKASLQIATKFALFTPIALAHQSSYCCRFALLSTTANKATC